MGDEQGPLFHANLPAGGGRLGELVREHDWSRSPLGAVGEWPQPLRTITELMLASSQPMFIAWGEERTLLYNDAYAEIARGLNPDLVVTDHLMPGMSGTELARRLQSDRPEIKVLVVSGYAESGGVAPDVPRLTKPFRNADLAASLAALG